MRTPRSSQHVRQGLYLAVVGLLSSMPAAAAGIDDLRWLGGCWARDGGEPGSGEQWMSPAGGSMLGLSRTVRNGKTTALEFIRIVETDDGGLHYIALPSGQALTAFVMTAISSDEVVFENPAHDFPQRVAYRRLSAERMVAWIDGDIDGQFRRIEFPMIAVDCVSSSTDK